jgi:hypothetical protein
MRIAKTYSIACEKKKQTTKQTMPYMNRGDSVAIVDATVKNRWRWEWLQDTDTQKHTIGDWCEKIDCAGLAFGREGHQKCYFLVFLQLKQYSFLA